MADTPGAKLMYSPTAARMRGVNAATLASVVKGRIVETVRRYPLIPAERVQVKS